MSAIPKQHLSLLKFLECSDLAFRTNLHAIEIQVKFHKKTEKEILAETKNQERAWLPKSQIEISSYLGKFENDEWYEIRIPFKLYRKFSYPKI
ncbi:MAG: hypothetical protein ACFFAN_09610 [Promethearchaeota archaeon]